MKYNQNIDADYTLIFKRINYLQDNIEPCIIIGIDGKCGSGKSTLAKLIARTYDCNVFHMDDFFLPANLRTDERLKEVGGNVDYERFDKCIISGIKSNIPFDYKAFNCKTMCLGEKINIAPKKLILLKAHIACIIT